MSQKRRLTEIVLNTQCLVYEGDSVLGCRNVTESQAKCIADNLISYGVIVPPCKIGDKVRFSETGRIGVVTSFYCCDNSDAGNLWIRVVEDQGRTSQRVNVSASDFGKTVFVVSEDEK